MIVSAVNAPTNANRIGPPINSVRRLYQFASPRLSASLFITSAQPATSRYKTIQVLNVSVLMDTSRGREADVVDRPRKKPTPRQTIPTTIKVRHSRNIIINRIVHPHQTFALCQIFL